MASIRGMAAIVYAYKNCDTCRKALKWLEENGVEHEVRAIRETPPAAAELERALAALGGEKRRLFNTSGGDYRELNLKETLPAMPEKEAIRLLSGNGNLVKRPLLFSGNTVLAGFDAAAWKAALG